MTERVWSCGDAAGEILCDGETFCFVEDGNGEYAYREHELAAFIVDALNEKEARKTTVGAALRELLPDATILKIGPIDT